MRLTLKHRLKLCWEILTEAECDEKALPVFMRGYGAGMKDARLSQSEDTEFTDESISSFFKTLSTSPESGDFNHIPDAGKKVVQIKAVKSQEKTE